MESLYLLIPLSIAIVFLAIWFFFRMSDSGQFDDMVGPGLRLLQDDDAAREQGRDYSGRLHSD
jgi:cbb3-type cytochrome oxidase maturation protein